MLDILISLLTNINVLALAFARLGGEGCLCHSWWFLLNNSGSIWIECCLNLVHIYLTRAAESGRTNFAHPSCSSQIWTISFQNNFINVKVSLPVQNWIAHLFVKEISKAVDSFSSNRDVQSKNSLEGRRGAPPPADCRCQCRRRHWILPNSMEMLSKGELTYAVYDFIPAIILPDIS